MAQGKIKNADIASGAAIDRTKLAAGTANGVVVNDGSGALTSVAPGTSGNVLTSNGTSWASSPAPSGLPTATNTGDIVRWNGSAWAAQRPLSSKAPPIRLGGLATRLYCDGVVSVGSTTVPKDQIRGDFFTAPYTGTLAKIGITTAGAVTGAVGRLLIYALDSSNVPAGRLVDSGGINLSTANTFTADIAVPVVAQTTYLLALLSGNTGAGGGPSVQTKNSCLIYGLYPGSGTLILGLQASQAYGPGPATFPSAIDNTSSFSNTPLIFVEYA